MTFRPQRVPSRIVSSLYGRRVASAFGSTVFSDQESLVRIHTLEDLESLVEQAFLEQTKGNFRKALELYGNILRALDETMNEYFPVDDPTSGRDTVLKKRQEIEDICVAIRQSLDVALEGAEDTGPSEEDLSIAMEGYKSSSTCVLVVHIVSLICAAIFTYSLLQTRPRCKSKYMEIAVFTYFPIGVIMILYGIAQRVRLSEIDYKPEKLDLTTRRLWPKGSFMDGVETKFWIMEFIRLIWFIYAIYILGSKRASDCFEEASPDTGAEYVSLFLVILFISCLDFWMKLFICALLPCCCLLLGVFLLHSYREYKKQQPVGMKQKHFKKLDELTYKEGVVDEEHATCIVCLADFEDGDAIRVLPCSGGHAFHTECIDKWLIKNDTCPQCREHIIKKVRNKKGPRQQNDVDDPQGDQLVINLVSVSTNVPPEYSV